MFVETLLPLDHSRRFGNLASQQEKLRNMISMLNFMSVECYIAVFINVKWIICYKFDDN